MQLLALPSNLTATLDTISVNILELASPISALVTLYHHYLFPYLSWWDGPGYSAHHCISKTYHPAWFLEGPQMLAGWWLISWHLQWMGFSWQKWGQHFQRPQDSSRCGKREISQGLSLGPVSYTIPSQSLWECRLKINRVCGTLPWGFPGREHHSFPGGWCRRMQRPSDSLTILWLQQPLFLP